MNIFPLNKNNGCNFCSFLWECLDLPMGLHRGATPREGQDLQVGLQGGQHHQVHDRRDLCSRHCIWGELYIISYVLILYVEVFGQWVFAGGCTDDWYISLGIPYSFTIELPERDADGFHGFLLPKGPANTTIFLSTAFGLCQF